MPGTGCSPYVKMKQDPLYSILHCEVLSVGGDGGLLSVASHSAKMLGPSMVVQRTKHGPGTQVPGLERGWTHGSQQGRAP